jgi:hypothetical protein
MGFEPNHDFAKVITSSRTPLLSGLGNALVPFTYLMGLRLTS